MQVTNLQEKDGRSNWQCILYMSDKEVESMVNF